MSLMVRSTGAARLIELLRREGIRNEAVLAAIAEVPRQQFVEPTLAHKAYENTALPIGQGQTISQPYIVARMTELLLEQRSPRTVLEVGTGSGYQTAVLAKLIERVFSIERLQSLQYQAKRRLRNLDLHNIGFRHGDGWEGWSSKAPFDAIVVTAAPEQLPDALLWQLAEQGQLICPVGGASQVLKRITREGDRFVSEQLEAVKFVPLVKGLPD